jgi:parallel beta-helix repeat protein
MKKISLLIHVLLICQFAGATNYYLANTGNDNNKGTSPHQAWYSIDRLNNTRLQPGDSIFFRSGDVFTGQIEIKVSGIEGNPVFIGSYGIGKKPVITGALKIEDWKEGDCGVFTSRLDKKVNSLFLDDQWQTLARYPNTGFARVQTGNDQTGFYDENLEAFGNSIEKAGVRIRTNNWVYESRIIGNNHEGNITFEKDERYPIENGYEYRIDSLGNNTMYPVRAGYGYYIENKRELLDTLNEWFYDAEKGKLHYYKNGPGVITAGVYDYGILLSPEAGHITIENLQFEKFEIAGIYCPNSATNITVNNCTFRLINGSGVRFDHISFQCAITNNDIHDITGRGVSMPCTERSTVSGNNIRRIGLARGQGWSGVCGATGIVIMNKETEIQTPPFANNNLVAYNVIDSCGYAGIRVDGQYNTIEYNIVKNCMLTLNDGAGIYCFARQAGVTCHNTIRHNIVLNTRGDNVGTPGNGMIAKGIYLDNYTHDITVDNNTVVGCTSGGIHVNAGSHNNIITNNNLFSNSIGISFAEWGNLGRVENNLVANNTICGKNKNQNAVELTNWITPEFNFGVFKNNIYCNLTKEYFLKATSGHGNYHRILEMNVTGWFEKFGFDADSKYLSNQNNGPYKRAEIFYNDTRENKILQFDCSSYYDFSYQALENELILKPFESIILLRIE